MQSKNDKARPTATARACVKLVRDVCEEADATGRFFATCYLPPLADRPRLIALRRRISQLQRRWRLLPRVAAFLTRKLQAAVAAIPLEFMWKIEFNNVVTTQGRNFALDTTLSGSGYTATWYVSLMSATSYTTGPSIGDTAALHGGWVEDQNYSEATRPAATFSSASAARKSFTTPVNFTIDMDTTVKGCNLWSVSTKGAATGTLYSVGPFVEGDQILPAGAILAVSYEAGM